MLSAGTPAPTFTLTASDGQELSLDQYRGRWVVLWWYPEASSSGCSVQAASLQSSAAKFAAQNVQLLGISFNTVEQNDGFSCGFDLTFPLLSDPDRAVGTAYGVLRQPGEPFDDKPHRMTFIIDPDGTIAFSELVPPDAVHGYADRALEQLEQAKTTATG